MRIVLYGTIINFTSKKQDIDFKNYVFTILLAE